MPKLILLLVAGALLLLVFLYHDSFYLIPLFILIMFFIIQNIHFKHKLKINLTIPTRLKKIKRKYVYGFGISIFFLTLAILALFNFKNIQLKTTKVQTRRACEENLTLKKAKQCTFPVIRDDDSHGSGFSVINKYIITNKHVIEGASSLHTEINGEEVELKTWNYSPSYDIAILKIEKDIPACEWFDSKSLNPAETLHAIGWPLEYTGDSTISKGIFSRYYEYNDFNYIQTDTPINPGNSGGPLINKCGIVGINTIKVSAEGIEGLGFALTSSDLIGLVKRLIADGGEDTEIPIAIEDDSQSESNNYVAPNTARSINVEDVRAYLSDLYRARNSWMHGGNYSREDRNKLIDLFNRQIVFCETLVSRLSQRSSTQDDIFMWDSIVKMSYESSYLANKLNGN